MKTGTKTPRGVNVPRQLGILTLLFIGVSLVTLVALVMLVRNVVGQSSALSESALRSAQASYTLLDKVGAVQTALQQLLRSKDPDEMEKILKQMDALSAETEKLLAALGPKGSAITTNFALLRASQKKAVDQVLQGNAGAAHEEFLSQTSARQEAVLDQVDRLRAKVEASTREEISVQAARTDEEVKRWSLTGAGLVGVAALFGYGLRHRVVKALRRLSDQLADTSIQVEQAAAQLANGSQSVADSSSEQAASLEETSSSLEEISSMTRRNSENAGTGKGLSTEARQRAEQGQGCLEDMARTLTDVTVATRELEGALQGMQTSNSEVANIIRTIDEIAFQTNILALNAAVEAARAGEAGMGFAVVADEVRNLAQRSAQAARDTAQKIEASLKRSESSTAANARVANNLQLLQAKAAEVQANFREIVEKTRSVDNLVAEIATASNEQDQGIQQLNSAVSDMDRVTQSTAANAEETASAAQELSRQSIQLKDAVQLLLRMANASKRHRRSPSVETPEVSASPVAEPQREGGPVRRRPKSPPPPEKPNFTDRRMVA